METGGVTEHVTLEKYPIKALAHGPITYTRAVS